MPNYNVLNLMGGFSKDTISKFFNQIDELPLAPVLVYMMGTGGAVSYKQAIIDTLVSFDVPITVVSRGYCGSACALFPHSGDFVRLAYPNTSFVYHARQNSLEGNVDELEDRVTRFKTQIERDKLIFMEQVGLTRKQASVYQGSDKTIDAPEALVVGKHGMLDGIIIKDYRDGRFLIKTREGNKEIDITQHRRSDLKNLPIVKG